MRHDLAHPLPDIYGDAPRPFRLLEFLAQLVWFVWVGGWLLIGLVLLIAIASVQA